jgi:predicted nuclease with TOPRIM domain
MSRLEEILIEGVEIKELNRRVSIADLKRVYVMAYNMVSATAKLRALSTLARTDMRVKDIREKLDKVNKSIKELQNKRDEGKWTAEDAQEYYKLLAERQELNDKLWDRLPEYKKLRDIYRDIRKQASRALREHFGLTPKLVEPIVQAELEAIRQNMGMAAPDGADSQGGEEKEVKEGEGVAESAKSPLSFFDCRDSILLTSRGGLSPLSAPL